MPSGWNGSRVIGVSAGGPYAAACGYDLPERVSRVAIVCGLGPPESMGQGAQMRLVRPVGSARRGGFRSGLPVALRALCARCALGGEKGYALWVRRYSAADREVLQRPEVRSTIKLHQTVRHHQLRRCQFGRDTRADMLGLPQSRLI